MWPSIKFQYFAHPFCTGAPRVWFVFKIASRVTHAIDWTFVCQISKKFMTFRPGVITPASTFKKIRIFLSCDLDLWSFKCGIPWGHCFHQVWRCVTICSSVMTHFMPQFCEAWWPWPLTSWSPNMCCMLHCLLNLSKPFILQLQSWTGQTDGRRTMLNTASYWEGRLINLSRNLVHISRWHQREGRLERETCPRQNLQRRLHRSLFRRLTRLQPSLASTMQTHRFHKSLDIMWVDFYSSSFVMLTSWLFRILCSMQNILQWCLPPAN